MQHISGLGELQYVHTDQPSTFSHEYYAIVNSVVCVAFIATMGQVPWPATVYAVAYTVTVLVYAL